MKKILNVNTTSSATDIALLVARTGIAAFMLTHGIPKLLMLLSGAPVQFPPILGMSAELSLGLAVFAEVFCSILLLAGFATRLAVIPLIITMVIALVFIHAADPFAKQELAFQYLLVYLVLLFAGSGKFSIDYLLQGKKQPGNYSIKRTAMALNQ
ncbi:DoxX family protein [Flavisolibacter ginsengisoli]|jgi:putative oxidoreductase|uniref:Putative oxidoreductase n=1 Tax=Flavisolibacter ginsengisoli DSM 18119 TaxID=1121884 RepID=A0A1M4SDJ9_9BACT|nr:DoxX family protein [Flavisolibacter ginsengisoli]SHE30289.1 putative oxidoreductase [Flavisolibacter ginsengisoli DSM 18119]